MADAGRTQVSSRNPLLVGVQVALAVTLLVGAGVLLRSFEEFGRVSPGFEISHVLTLRISGNWGETGEMKKLTGRINRTLDELSISPGVRAAATSATLPGIPDDYRMEVKLAEGRVDSQCEIVADTRFVSNGYFRGIQIPLEAGQRCRESLNYFDGVVVNGSFEPARAVFHISPLEQHLSHSFAENRLRTIPLSLYALTAVSY